MKALKIKGSNTSFTTILDKKNNIFNMSGVSRPEDSNEYFAPIFNWIDEYFQSPNSETTMEFQLQYYDTSTTKNLLRLILKLNEYFLKGISIKIKWYYQDDDEDILDSGEDLAHFVKIPFEFIIYK